MRISRLLFVGFCVFAALVPWGSPAAVAARDAAPVQVARSDRTASTDRWRWPVSPPRIETPYRAPATKYGAGHRGIDLAAPPRGTVAAPASGVVHFVGTVVDRPLVTIAVPHGVLVSMEPVTSELRKGDAVAQGDVVGVVSEGTHCLSCLHVGVRVNGEYVSPLRYFASVQRAVLLPLS